MSKGKDLLTIDLFKLLFFRGQSQKPALTIAANT